MTQEQEDDFEGENFEGEGQIEYSLKEIRNALEWLIRDRLAQGYYDSAKSFKYHEERDKKRIELSFRTGGHD